MGSVVLLLDGPASPLTDEIHTRLGELPGVGHCALDVAAGTLLVTAQEPVDRADVIAVLDRLGCRVRT